MAKAQILQGGLVNGISQQPARVRLPNRAERQVNCVSSPLDGLTRRPPSKHLRQVVDGPPPDALIHEINRDRSERYISVLSHASVRVFDLEGEEVDVRDRTGETSVHGADSEFVYLDSRGFDFSAATAQNLIPMPAAEDFLDPSWTLAGDFAVDGPFGLTGPLGFGEWEQVKVNAGGTDGDIFISTFGFTETDLNWSCYVRRPPTNFSPTFELQVRDITGTTVDYTATFTWGTDALGNVTLTGSTADAAVTAFVEEAKGDDSFRVGIKVDASLLSGNTVKGTDTSSFRLRFPAADASIDWLLYVWGAHAIASNKAGLFPYAVPAKENLRAVTASDTTIITNANKQCQISTAESAPVVSDLIADINWPTTGLAPVTAVAYVHVKQMAFETDYAITVNPTGGGSTTQTVKSWDGTDPAKTNSDTGEIALALAANINLFAGANPTFADNVSIMASGSIISFYFRQGVDELTITDGGGDLLMTVAVDEVDTISELPPKAHHGARFKIVPAQEEGQSDSVGYYAQYVADVVPTLPVSSGQALPDGHWEEGNDYGTRTDFDRATMPHQLVRKQYDSAGDFQDGTTATPKGKPFDVYFEWLQVPYDQRLVGDEELNPRPKFLAGEGNPKPTVNDVAFFRGRLIFLSDDTVFCSAAGDLFQFWRSTTRLVPDDDRIIAPVSHTRVALLERVVPFNDDALIFTDRTQFRMSGEPALTPSTVKIAPVLEYTSQTRRAAPVPSGRGVYFAYPVAESNFVGVREVFPLNDELEERDTTLDVQRYIPGEPQDIAVDDRDQTVVVTASGAPNKLFVLKTLVEGNQELQSAWSEFEFDAGCTIESVGFIGRILVMLIQRDDGLFLESMDLTEGSVDTGGNYAVRLDRRVDETNPNVTIAFTATETNWDFDFFFNDPTKVVGAQKAGATEGQILTPNSVTQQLGGTRVTFPGIVPGPLWVGEKYTSEYEFSEVHFKVETQAAPVAALLAYVMLLNARTSYVNTGSLDLVIAVDGRESETIQLRPDTEGALLPAGLLESPINGRNVETTVTLRSDSPTPFRVINHEWDSDTVSEGRRLQA